jgi:hypothetical protein
MYNQSTEEEVEGLPFSTDEAALLLQDWFARKAARMSKENVSLIEDLIQEMSMGVLQCDGEHTLSYFRERSVMRAKNFLRAEARQAGRAKRYSRLALKIHDEHDAPFIEGLLDFQDRIEIQADDYQNDSLALDEDRRASA